MEELDSNVSKSKKNGRPIIWRLPPHVKFDFLQDEEDIPGIPPIVIEMMIRTRRLYRTWWAAHYVVGVTGVIAGALLTAITSSTASGSGEASGLLQSLQQYSWLIGIVAAVATSMVTFLGPINKAARYYSAYHHLEQACLEYRGHDVDEKTTRLLKRVMQARKMLQIVDSESSRELLTSSPLGDASSN